MDRKTLMGVFLLVWCPINFFSADRQLTCENTCKNAVKSSCENSGYTYNENSVVSWSESTAGDYFLSKQEWQVKK